MVDEPLGTPEVYGNDRVFVSMVLDGESDSQVEGRLNALEKSGHPIVHLRLDDRYDLGQEFFRWEFATAVAGAVLQINPFDQPNVAESKANTKAVLAKGGALSTAASAAELKEFLAGIKAGDYLAIMAYLPPTPENDARLVRDPRPTQGPSEGGDHARLRAAFPPFDRTAAQGWQASGAFSADHRANQE